MRELQARLRQVAWLYDGPTGSYDDLTEQAVKGFQGKRGLPRTGKTDTVTWQRLLRMTHEPGKWELYLMGGQPADAPDARCLTGRVLCISKTSRTLRWMIDGRTVSTDVGALRLAGHADPGRCVQRLLEVPPPCVDALRLPDAVRDVLQRRPGGALLADFAAHGYAGASHGCVNVRDEAAIADLFGQVRNGDKVVVHW